MSIRQTVTITILLTLMLGLLPLAGCGGVDTTQHLGRWTGADPDMDQQVTFEFREGGVLAMIVGPMTIEGTYTIDYTTTPIQVSMTMAVFGPEDTTYGIAEFVDANTLRIAAGDDTPDSRPASFADASANEIIELKRQTQ